MGNPYREKPTIIYFNLGVVRLPSFASGKPIFDHEDRVWNFLVFRVQVMTPVLTAKLVGQYINVDAFALFSSTVQVWKNPLYRGKKSGKMLFVLYGFPQCLMNCLCSNLFSRLSLTLTFSDFLCR